MNTYFSVLKTKVCGDLYIAANLNEIISISFKQNWSEVKKEYTSLEKRETAIIKQAKKELQEYLNGKRKKFDFKFQEEGTPFQKTVWKALRSVPFGKTISYLELATIIKMPKAVRAVANANGKNPLCVTTPCHRIIQKNGDLGGFSGGILNKEKLIAFEKSKAVTTL
jgi:methylated-DNA-[protein]-cysteine S-methyltransferase